MRYASILALCVWSMQAAAAPEIRAADLDRLARYDEAAGRAILDAFARGAPDDIQALREALSGRPLAPDPAGDWRCRTIKAGGRTGLAAFGQFACRISTIGATEWQFEKLGGTERARGTIAFHEGRAVYRGTGFAPETPALPYEELGPGRDPADAGSTVPQIAIFEQTGPNEARLTFPYPVGDSDFDVLHLTR